MKTSGRGQQASGFTLVEVLISLVIMTVGLAGVLAMHNTVTRANADSRRLDRARQIAEQLMEELRGFDVATVEIKAASFPDTLPPASDGTAYQREVVVTPVAAETNLVLIHVAVSFAERGDDSNRHFARLEMLRTRTEGL